MNKKIESQNLNFTDCRILVLGDLILDRYVYGNVTRVSPEAPVPVVKVKSSISYLGGAGNVAHNLITLGGKVWLIGKTGQDEAAQELQQLLSQKNITHHLLQQTQSTITKTRIIGEHQQIARIDVEEFVETSPAQADIIMSAFEKWITQVDVVIISDYAKGFCTASLCQQIVTRSKQLNKKTLVDPKGTDWSKYQGAFLVTPNLQELREVSHQKDLENNNSSLVSVGKKLCQKYALPNLLITRSSLGMTLLEEAQEPVHISSVAQEVFDVSGAGDTVVATLAIAVAKKFPLAQAAQLANQAAGIAVSKQGTAPVYIDEIVNKQSYNWQRKIVDIDELSKLLSSSTNTQLKVVFTNGCFDLLHAGHLHLLNEAKKQGDILIVAVNSDNSIKQLKGNNRPILGEKERLQMLASLSVIDFVILFEENTPEKLISQIKPHTLVKGGDYTQTNVIGRQYAEKVYIVPTLENFSTTALLARLKANL